MMEKLPPNTTRAMLWDILGWLIFVLNYHINLFKKLTKINIYSTVGNIEFNV